MGFLSNLLTREAKKLASDVVSNLGDNLRSELNMSTSSTTSSYTKPKKELSGEKGLRERLEEVIRNEWSEYELRREIPASELGADFGAKKYSYGLYYNGEPKAMMMVLTDRNEYRKKSVTLSQDACYEKGVAYMNFMCHLPNRTDYISQRLRENIR